jgi:hypothetical protein
MEAIRSSEIHEFLHTAWHYNSDGHTIQVLDYYDHYNTIITIYIYLHFKHNMVTLHIYTWHTKVCLFLQPEYGNLLYCGHNMNAGTYMWITGVGPSQAQYYSQLISSGTLSSHNKTIARNKKNISCSSNRYSESPFSVLRKVVTSVFHDFPQFLQANT